MTEEETTSEGAPAAQPETPRALRRSSSDRVIAGVCGGLGRYLGVDPVVIRIAAIALVFAGGAGLLLYLIGWVVMPLDEEGAQPPAADARQPTRHGTRIVLGVLFVLLGSFFLLDELLPDVFDWRFVGPAILIVAGVGLLASRRT